MGALATVTLDPCTATFSVGRSDKGLRAWISMQDDSGQSHVVGCFFGLEESFLRQVAEEVTDALRDGAKPYTVVDAQSAV